MKKISEVTQTTDVGTHKKSMIPIVQVKFRDYETAKSKKDSVWELISTTLSLPKANIAVDDSHLDKHTTNYKRPLTVSYNLSSGDSALNIDKGIATKGIGAVTQAITGVDGVEKVWDLLSKS